MKHSTYVSLSHLARVARLVSAHRNGQPDGSRQARRHAGAVQAAALAGGAGCAVMPCCDAGLQPRARLVARIRTAHQASGCAVGACGRRGWVLACDSRGEGGGAREAPAALQSWPADVARRRVG